MPQTESSQQWGLRQLAFQNTSRMGFYPDFELGHILGLIHLLGLEPLHLKLFGPLQKLSS